MSLKDIAFTRISLTELEALRGEIERLRAALQELVEAVTGEVNEKGGSGYILARLSDARRALEPKP